MLFRPPWGGKMVIINDLIDGVELINAKGKGEPYDDLKVTITQHLIEYIDHEYTNSLIINYINHWLLRDANYTIELQDFIIDQMEVDFNFLYGQINDVYDDIVSNFQDDVQTSLNNIQVIDHSVMAILKTFEQLVLDESVFWSKEKYSLLMDYLGITGDLTVNTIGTSIGQLRDMIQTNTNAIDGIEIGVEPEIESRINQIELFKENLSLYTLPIINGRLEWLENNIQGGNVPDLQTIIDRLNIIEETNNTITDFTYRHMGEAFLNIQSTVIEPNQDIYLFLADLMQTAIGEGENEQSFFIQNLGSVIHRLTGEISTIKGKLDVSIPVFSYKAWLLYFSNLLSESDPK